MYCLDNDAFGKAI